MSKIVLEANKRRASCNVCNRQSKNQNGLKDFTCFSCGLSYTHEGTVDWTLRISKKKLYDEFYDKGIKLTDREVDVIFASCFTISNRKDIKLRPTFQSMVALAIDAHLKKGTKSTMLTRDTGLVTPDGRKVEKEI